MRILSFTASLGAWQAAPGPLYRRLAAAIAAAVTGGRLPAGSRRHAGARALSGVPAGGRGAPARWRHRWWSGAIARRGGGLGAVARRGRRPGRSGRGGRAGVGERGERAGGGGG